MSKNNKNGDSKAFSAGQAMLEYALLTSVVLIAGIAFYMTGWFEGVQNYVCDVLLNVSLPMP